MGSGACYGVLGGWVLADFNVLMPKILRLGGISRQLVKPMTVVFTCTSAGVAL